MVKEYIGITTFGMLFIIFSSFETALAMESNELPEEGISKKLTKTSDMDSRDPESSRNKVISELIKKVDTLQAHEEDYIDLFKDLINSQVISSIRKNIKANKSILELLQKFKENTITTDGIINKILFLRFSFIDSRQKNTFIFNKEPKGSILYGPTSPNIYDSLTSDQKILADKAIDKYQMFNRLIIGLSQLIDFRNLSTPTKELFRASKTLCSIIESQSSDLGHPDQTFIIGDNKGNEMSDWECFITYIRESETLYLHQYSTFYKSPEKTEIKGEKVTPREKKIFEPEFEHPFASRELPYPDFLKPSQVNPRSATELASLPNKEEKDHTHQNQQKKRKKHIKLRTEKGISESSKLSSKSLETSLLANSASALAPLKQEKTSITKEEKVSANVISKDIMEASNVGGSKSQPLHSQERTQEQETKNPLKSEPVLLRSRPRGAILYETPRAHIRSNQLKGKHQATLEDIFDPKKFTSVTYKKLATLWRHINGENSISEGKRGSHKELRDSKDKVIAGIFAHGDSQTFGHRSIKYIRDALIEIGYGAMQLTPVDTGDSIFDNESVCCDHDRLYGHVPE